MFLHLQAKSVVAWSLVFSGAALPLGACASPELQIAHVEPAVTKTGPIGLIVMARKDVAQGEKLSVEDLELIPVDEDRIPMETVREIGDALGKVVARRITSGQIINKMDLVSSPGKAVPVLIYVSPQISRKLETLANSKHISTSDMASQLVKESVERRLRRLFHRKAKCGFPK